MSKIINFKRWGFALIASVVIIGSVAGCGSEDNKAEGTKETASTSAANTEKTESTDAKTSTDTKAATDTKDTTKKQDTKITYENFMKVKMGQSYDEVVALLGEGTESASSEIAGIKTTIYSWTGSGMGNMNITFDGSAVTSKAQAFLQDPSANMTLDLYNKVENGMTYDQVKAILGEGELTSETKIMDAGATMYSYINKDGANANFTFLNDSMQSKSQINLK